MAKSMTTSIGGSTYHINVTDENYPKVIQDLGDKVAERDRIINSMREHAQMEQGELYKERQAHTDKVERLEHTIKNLEGIDAQLQRSLQRESARHEQLVEVRKKFDAVLAANVAYKDQAIRWSNELDEKATEIASLHKQLLELEQAKAEIIKTNDRRELDYLRRIDDFNTLAKTHQRVLREHDSLRSEHTQLLDYRQALEEQIGALETTIETLKETEEANLKLLSTHDEERKGYLDNIATLKNTLENEQQARKNLAAAKQAYEEKATGIIAERMNDLAFLRQQHSGYRAEARRQIAELLRAVKGREHTVREHEHTISSLQQHIASIPPPPPEKRTFRIKFGNWMKTGHFE